MHSTATMSQVSTAITRRTVPAYVTASPSTRAAGTPRAQHTDKIAREPQTSTPATTGPRGVQRTDAREAAWMPSTTTSAAAPAGPAVPPFMTSSERSRSYEAVSPSATSDSPSRCRARLPRASAPTATSATASGASSSSRPPQQMSPTSRPSGTTANGASSIARPATSRSTTVGGFHRRAVSVPTASRQESITARRSHQVGEQRHVGEQQRCRAYERHCGDSAAALAEPHADVEDRLEAELVERQ